jgi:dUTP pyrophosphatase
MTKRGFEVAGGFKDAKINLPERATKNAAGYDFECAKDTVIPTIWKSLAHTVALYVTRGSHFIKFEDANKEYIKPTLVPTGIKAYMGPTEGLFLYNRSSNPLKKFLLLGNGVGVVDSDYYENPDNDGHIMFQFINLGLKDIKIKKGERIGQGVFQPFLKTTDDLENGSDRSGGFGSTGN